MTKKAVILIDEDSGTRRSLGALLRSHGYAVFEIPLAIMPSIIHSGRREMLPAVRSGKAGTAEPRRAIPQKRKKKPSAKGTRAAKTEKIESLNLDMVQLRAGLDADKVLTERERAVLMEILKGASSKAAARTLEISPRTVEFHRANAMQKLGAKNAAELVRIILKRR